MRIDKLLANLKYGSRKMISQRIKKNDGQLSLGLGSVIIKSIIEAHNGVITVENNQGSNSGITLTIKFLY